MFGIEEELDISELVTDNNIWRAPTEQISGQHRQRYVSSSFVTVLCLLGCQSGVGQQTGLEIR